MGRGDGRAARAPLLHLPARDFRLERALPVLPEVRVTFRLRDYQQECLTFTDLALEKHSRVANVLPTGAGKGVIISAMAGRHLAERAGNRVLVVVHTEELVQQLANTAAACNPGVTVGVVKAERDETTASIIIASVQTLRSKERRDRIWAITKLIVDECHHATAVTYRTIINHYREDNALFVEKQGLSPLKVVGFTATLARSDEGDLSKVWQHVAYRRDILWMIRNRYLIDVRGLHVKVDDLDLKAVKKSGGDFQREDLGQALSDSMAPEVVAKALREHGPDRQTICFVPLVKSAYEFADAFALEGFKAEVVHGTLPKLERRAILSRYSSGVTQVLVNALVLTEGFDAPATSCVIVARPTKSKPLFQQMVGRGLRVDPERPWDEQDCLVMVVAGAEMHDLRSLVDLTEKEIRPKPDQTLLEAEDEAESAARETKPMWRGATKVKEFDPLLRASRRTWGHTKGTNTRYLAAGDVYVVLQENAETAGAWDVCWCNKVKPWDRTTKRIQDRTEYVGIPLDLAMDWGEDVADRMGGEGGSLLNTKGKTWRRGKDLSPNFKRTARSLGVAFEEGVTTKGELAEAIEVEMASRRIDPMVTRYREYLKQRESEGS